MIKIKSRWFLSKLIKLQERYFNVKIMYKCIREE